MDLQKHANSHLCTSKTLLSSMKLLLVNKTEANIPPGHCCSIFLKRLLFTDHNDIPILHQKLFCVMYYMWFQLPGKEEVDRHIIAR